ncbi:MAG: hypothetical protein SF172_16885 [Burkholderiales bacterium]|nr:hypothetical protein [Burkholderiales bacterium]
MTNGSHPGVRQSAVFGIACLLALCATLAPITSVHAFFGSSLPNGPYLRSEFTGGHLSNVIFVFKDGKAASNVREGDLEKFDFAAHKAKMPKNVGTFKTGGDTLTVNWDDGTKWEGKLKPDKAGGFDWRSAGYAPIKPLVRGAVLDGRFSGGASGAGAMVGFNYIFKADGTYTTLTAGNVTSKSARSTASAGTSSSAGGKYSVSGSTLTLTPASGAAKTHRIYFVPSGTNEKKPDMLIIDGIVATRSQ